MRSFLACLALALAAAPAMSEVIDDGKNIKVIGDGKKYFNKTLPKINIPAPKDFKKPLTEELEHLAKRIEDKSVEKYDELDGAWSKTVMRMMKLTEPITKAQAELVNKTKDELSAVSAWKDDAREKIQNYIDEKQANEEKHEQAWATLKSAMDNATDKFEYLIGHTVKGDLRYTMENVQDANAKDKAAIIAAATGGKITVTEKRIGQDEDADAAAGSAKFAKPPLIEITGNKSVSFRI